jgi:CDP-glycerol glycerophosphotransferase (TagB/SpsB family)
MAAAALPEHVAVHRHGETNLADLIVGCAAFVTDRSSLVHDAAYLNRPVILCRFDDGTSVPGLAPDTGDPGAGLGPVQPDPDAALEAVVALVESGCPAPSRQVEFADGRCCERAVERIRALTEPAAPTDVYDSARA